MNGTIYMEFPVVVDYDYHPAKPAIMPSPSCETGEPPEPEYFEITALSVKGKSLDPKMLTDEEWETIRERLELDEPEDYR